MKSIEWELKIAASFFPNTLQTLSKQVAPTVKPSVLQAIKENENKKIPKWALSFFFVLFNTFLLFFPFLGHSEFLENITAELSSPKSDCYQNSFFVSLCTRTHTHIMNWFVFCSMTSRNIIQRKLVFSPVGWKSWRVANISIKIMQSVELWLSFCGIVTVSFPSINLALCRFVASSLLNCPIRRIHFSQLFKKCPGFVFLNKWWHTHILWMCDMIVYISSIFKIKTF